MAHADHMCGPLSMRMAFPFDLLVRSLCPSIIGHDTVKAVVLLGLLGGTPPSSAGLVDMRSGVMIRSNIHCLIVGIPVRVDPPSCTCIWGINLCVILFHTPISHHEISIYVRKYLKTMPSSFVRWGYTTVGQYIIAH